MSQPDIKLSQLHDALSRLLTNPPAKTLLLATLEGLRLAYGTAEVAWMLSVLQEEVEVGRRFRTLKLAAKELRKCRK